MEIVNLTPHDIHIVTGITYADWDGIVTIPRSGTIARVQTDSVIVGHVNGIPLTRVVYGNVIDLPDETDDTMYVVSVLVRLARPDRTDLASPGDLVRNDAGVVIGCKSLNV